MKIGASVICMDPLNLEQDVRLLDKLGVDYYHIDVMDGWAVPRYGIYPEIVEAISDISDTPIDVHLMVDDVELAIDRFSSVRTVELVSFHLDMDNTYYFIDRIGQHNVDAGVVLNMATPLNFLDRIMTSIEGIMFMGIHPGVLGSSQVPRPETTITTIDRFFNNPQSAGYYYRNSIKPKMVQVDGGVYFDTVQPLIRAGANYIACGNSTLFNALGGEGADFRMRKIEANFKKLKDLIENVQTSNPDSGPGNKSGGGSKEL